VNLHNEYRLPDTFRADDIIIDIGAHIGSFCFAALQRGSHHVYGFEAEEGNHQCAVVNLRSFGERIRLCNQAVWRSDQVVDYLCFQPALVQENTAGGNVCMAEGGLRVSAVALDDVIREVTDGGRRRVRMLKIDCEGSEFPILLTARTLHLIDTIAGQFHEFGGDHDSSAIPTQARVEGYNRFTIAELTQALNRAGFKVSFHRAAGSHIGLFFANFKAKSRNRSGAFTVCPTEKRIQERPIPEVDQASVVFDVARVALTRVPDSRYPEGGFFCTNSLELPPGKYICEIDTKLPVCGAHVTLAALIMDAGNWRVLSNLAFPVMEQFRGEKVFSMTFHLDQPRTMTFHVHTDVAFSRTHVRRLQVRAPTKGPDGSRLPLPVLPPKPYTSWPVDRLRFVFIGTTSICNASCAQCPTNKELTRHLPRKVMAWDLFEKLIREIRDLKLAIDGHLSFGLYAEPLLDPLVLKRAALVKEYLPNVRLVITSNGGPLTEELARDLGRHVDNFSIHVEALSPALYHELMFPLHAEQVFPRVERLIQVCGKPVWIVCPTHKKNVHEVKALQQYWLARGAARVMLATFSNRCTDSLRAAEFALAPTPGACREDIAYDLTVDWDGAVLACCQDFLKRNQIGDLRHESLREVLSNPARNELFDKLHAGRWDDFVTCKNCRFDSQEALEMLLEE
jgi:FkbM family methyltransferase